MQGPARTGLATCAALITALALPSYAGAATTTVDFEAFNSGTSITNQYKDAGGTNYGVVFGQSPTGPQTPVPDVVSLSGAGQAQSGTKVADLCDSCGKEFSTTRTWGKFTFGKQFVRVYAGTPVGQFNATLQAYDAGGVLLDTETKQVAAGQGVHTLLEVTAPAGKQIAFFHIRPPSISNAGSVYLYIDDVQFDTPDPPAPPPGGGPPPEPTPPPPDFGLAFDPNQFFGDDLAVAKGKTAALTFLINRINNSQGPLTFSASGLPAGVTASFTPNNAANPTAVTVTFTASQNAGSANKTPVTITATPTAAGSSENNAPRSTQLLFTVLQNYDMRVLGIEVTQGIQTVISPTSTLPQPATPGTIVNYQGVNLVSNNKTFVRVFSNLAAPTNGSVSEVPMLLYGAKQNGGALPGSPLVGGLRTLQWSANTGVSYLMRASQGPEHTFVLPNSWTNNGTIKLEAKVLQPEVLLGPSASECEQAVCAQNNSFKLNNIPFLSTGAVQIGIYSLTASDEPALPSPKKVLDDAVEITPLGTGQLQFDPNFYIGSIDITDIAKANRVSGVVSPKACEIIELILANYCSMPISDGDDFKNTWVQLQFEDAIEGWLNARKEGLPQPWDIMMGVNWNTARGLASGGELGQWPHSVVQQNRPITSVAHELHHGLARDHASSCTKYGDPGTTENWPPDQNGFMQGIGLDRRPGSNGPGSAYNVLAPKNQSGLGSDDPSSPNFVPDDYYDLMSYCADFIAPDLDTWSSTLGWNLTFNALRGFMAAGGAAAAGEPRARASRLVDGVQVKGFALPGQPLVLTEVSPGKVPNGPAGTVLPAVQLELRNSAGNVVASAPVTAEVNHIDFGGGQVTLLEASAATGGAGAGQASAFASAALPSSVHDLQIKMGDGTVIASRVRSPNAPRVRVRRPGGGDRVGGGRTVDVRWSATDRDRDKLEVEIDYSSNDGRTWRPIWSGPNRGRVKLSSRLFAGSRRARLRVVANDGFNETEARSARFTAVGHRPAVAIVTPARGSRVGNDAVVNLVGAAFDDSGAPIATRRLRWFDGRRRIGRGPRVAVRNLAVGRHRIRLVARDRTGRSGAAQIRIRVTQAEPQFLALQVPISVNPTANRMRVWVGSTVPARLRVSGAGITPVTRKVGRIPKRTFVTLAPGADTLYPVFRLTAGKKRHQLVATVPRG